MTGLLSYAASFAMCVWRWRAMRWRGAPRGILLVLAAVQMALVVDIAFDIRWRLHAFWMGEAMEMHVYGERRGPQAVALVLLCGVLLAGAATILRRYGYRRGVAVALTGTMLSVGLWCCEMLSYHFVDLVLYRKIAGLMLVGLIWLGLAMATCFGVWLDSSSWPKPGRLEAVSSRVSAGRGAVRGSGPTSGQTSDQGRRR